MCCTCFYSCFTQTYYWQCIATCFSPIAQPLIHTVVWHNMSLLPAERWDMLNIKNAFLLLVFLMLGDVSLNADDGNESLNVPSLICI